MKKILKGLFSFLIALVSIFSMTSVNAESYPNKLKKKKKNYLINYSGYNLYYKTYSGGYAFCTSFHVQGVGTSCSLSSIQWSRPTQAGVAAIIKKYNSNKSQKNYYYAELAINEFLYYKETGNTVNRISSYYNTRNFNGVKDYYKVAVDAWNDAKKDYKISLSPSTINFRQSGDYYISDKITVSSTGGDTASYDVTLDGDVKAEVYNKSGNSFYVRVKKSEIKTGTTSNINVSVKATKNLDIAQKFDCGSYNQTLTPNSYMTIAYATATAKVAGKITLKGNKVNINKVDSETKKAVKGATLVVKNKNDKEVARFTTDEKAYKLENLDAGEYTVSELNAPEGYKKSSKTVKFTVENDDKTINVTFENDKIKNPVEISKKDATTSKELPGAHLVVKDEAGNIVDEWTSTDEEHKIKDLKAGNYTLSETIAPEGYRLQTTTVGFTVKGDGTTTKVEMLNEPMKNTVVKINKIDSETKKYVKGAVIQIKDSKGKVVKEFTTSAKAYNISDLEVGSYTAEEVKAPSGYELNKTKVPFKVEKNDKTINVEILNKKYVTKVEVSKKDATTSKELPGAHLVVKDEAGNVVDEWTSTDEVHIIKGLKEGKYTLSETIAPEGYRLQTTTVGFEVKADGTTTKVEMLNEPMKNTVVKINKIDSETKEYVKGATLIIKDASGNVVKEFVTDSKAFEISDLAKGVYTVSELKAPIGYIKSNEVMEFTIGQDDKTIDVNFENSKEVIVNNIEISKKDATTSVELPGAHLVLKDESGNVIDEWVSTNQVHLVKDVKAGKYTLTETIAPEGYVLSEETVEFTVKGDGTVTKVVMYNTKENSPVPPAPVNPDKHQVEISKQDIATKSELPGATLIIKDANGNEIDRWVSGTTPHYIELDCGNYTLTEVQAPVGYDLSYEVVKFTVTDTKDIERVVMYNSKTPNTSGRNIAYVLTAMFVSLTGVLGSIFKIKRRKNS